MDKKIVESRLWSVFENINSWLKYAEGKNAYILAFIGTQITLMKCLDFQVNCSLILSFIFLGSCFLVCIISFFPKTIISAWMYNLTRSHQKRGEKDNLLFYGHIAKYSIDQYVDKISQYLGYEIKKDKYFEDMCAQIAINANIADTKFNMFKICFWLMLFGQISFILSLIG